MQTDEWRPYEPCKENEERAEKYRLWYSGWDRLVKTMNKVYEGLIASGVEKFERKFDEAGHEYYICIPSESAAEVRIMSDYCNELTRMTSKQWSAYMRSPGPLGGYQIPRTPKDRRRASMPQNFGTPPAKCRECDTVYVNQQYRYGCLCSKKLPPRRDTAVERGMRFHRHLEQEIDVQADLLRRYPRLFDLSDAND